MVLCTSAESREDSKIASLPWAAAAKSLQSCPTVWPHRQEPSRFPRPLDSPDKNTGVGCHFLLQCRKVKSENEVTQSCLTLRDPMDRSQPGSSIHGIFQARVLEWVATAFSTSWCYSQPTGSPVDGQLGGVSTDPFCKMEIGRNLKQQSKRWKAKSFIPDIPCSL